MSRYTIKNLRDEVVQQNSYFLDAGAPLFFKEQGRNGYQAVDLYKVEPDGSCSCLRLAGSGTSREAAIEMFEEFRASMRLFKRGRYPIESREQVKKLLVINNINFNSDFHELPSFIVDALVLMAKATKYRKPRGANGSIARYFFNHLANKV